MKKLNFWMVVIGCILAILGSCSTEDEEASTATSVTSTTASGSITVGSETLSRLANVRSIGLRICQQPIANHKNRRSI